MATGRRQPKPIDPAITRERQLQEFGAPELACSVCGITEPAVMRRQAYQLIEGHHVDGEAVGDLLLPLCKNCHALIHASRRANEDLFSHIVDQSPLHQIAAAKVGRSNFFELLAWRDRADAEWLIQMDRALVVAIGEGWWRRYGIPVFPGRPVSKKASS